MANLVQLANDLEFVPKEQLIQMSQNPNSEYPSFLVLSEIQRRTQMEKMYAAQQPKPQTSVAEELVTEFAGSPSGLGAMAQSSDLQQAFPSGDMSNMAPPSPMQMMASGGRTGYQTGRGIQSTLNSPMQDEIDKEEIDKNIGQLFQQYGAPALKTMGVLNQDGSINYVGSAIALASLNPAFRIGANLAKGAFGLGSRLVNKFSPGLLQGAKNLVTKPNPVLQGGLKRGQRRTFDPKTKTRETIDTATGKVIPERVINTKGLFDAGQYGALGTLGIGSLIRSGRERAAEQARIDELDRIALEEKEKADEEKRLADEAARLAEMEAEKNRLLAEEKKRRGSDLLIGLGGAIASARNVGELGKGISDTYFKLRAAEEGSETKALQAELLKAQVANIEANVENMELKQLQSSAAIIQEGMETGTLDRKEYESTLQAIVARITLLQNLEATGLNQNNDIYRKTGVSITGRS
tara:strand:- start:590 stop:1987 length:1398 start_codon:yes stop_codon:yes gene_type:complete